MNSSVKSKHRRERSNLKKLLFALLILLCASGRINAQMTPHYSFSFSVLFTSDDNYTWYDYQATGNTTCNGSCPSAFHSGSVTVTIGTYGQTLTNQDRVTPSTNMSFGLDVEVPNFQGVLDLEAEGEVVCTIVGPIQTFFPDPPTTWDEIAITYFSNSATVSPYPLYPDCENTAEPDYPNGLFPPANVVNSPTGTGITPSAFNIKVHLRKLSTDTWWYQLGSYHYHGMSPSPNLAQLCTVYGSMPSYPPGTKVPTYPTPTR
jgi:hypothetical protein